MELITNPKEIEEKSLAMITEILGNKQLKKGCESVIKRVIHTTADFEYADNLVFSENAIEVAQNIFKNGASLITDTNMAKAGVNKKALEKLNCSVDCFIGNEEVSRKAKELGVTRAGIAVEHAFKNTKGPRIFVVGNAPTSLIKLYDLVKSGDEKPDFIIGVPVGFVNVIESKEMIMELDIPYIIAKGRKGGSNVAAAICNALMYDLVTRD